MRRILLSMALKCPDCVRDFKADDWQELLSQAYATDTVSKLSALVFDSELRKFIPESILWHFKSAQILDESHQIDVNI